MRALIQIKAHRRHQGDSPAMDDRKTQLQRRIALYRCYLSEGVSADQAILYLDQLRRDEGELRAMAQPVTTDATTGVVTLDAPPGSCGAPE